MHLAPPPLLFPPLRGRIAHAYKAPINPSAPSLTHRWRGQMKKALRASPIRPLKHLQPIYFRVARLPSLQPSSGLPPFIVLGSPGTLTIFYFRVANRKNLPFFCHFRVATALTHFRVAIRRPPPPTPEAWPGLPWPGHGGLRCPALPGPTACEALTLRCFVMPCDALCCLVMPRDASWCLVLLCVAS